MPLNDNPPHRDAKHATHAVHKPRHTIQCMTTVPIISPLNYMDTWRCALVHSNTTYAMRDGSVEPVVTQVEIMKL